MNRKLFDKYFFKILPKQNWLIDKEPELINMISLCKTDQQKDLIFELLEDFQFINSDILKRYIESIADYIINESGFDINKTLIVGMAMDDEPDSSQWILQQLRPVLTKKGWNNVKIMTRFDKGVKLLNMGYLTQLILVDEFIGSGQSVVGRINLLKERAKKDYEIKACFIAGMEFGIKRVIDSFSDFRCFIPLKKGISEKYSDGKRDLAINNMIELESTLLPQINNKELTEYHFGFNEAEALYSSFGNTPNSVFPFFWWPYDFYSNNRNPILIRNQEGFGL
jgi:hypothetical protein